MNISFFQAINDVSNESDLKFDSLRNKTQELVNKTVKQRNESNDKYLELEEEIKELNNVLNEERVRNKSKIEEQIKIRKDFEIKLIESEKQLKNKEKELNEFKEKVYIFQLINNFIINFNYCLRIRNKNYL